MPYKIVSEDNGFWVENAQTGKRQHKKKYKTRAQAIRLQRALEANVSDAKSKKHGTYHAADEKDKVQAIHNHACALGAECNGMDEAESKGIKAAKYMLDIGMDEEAGEAYARQELTDISSACSALQSLTWLSSEMDEPDDAKEVAALMRGIVNFIMGEIDEMEAAATGGEGKSATMATTTTTSGQTYTTNISALPKGTIQVLDTQPKEPEVHTLDTSYVKSIGVLVPDSMLAVKFVGRDEIRHPVFLWGSPDKLDIERDYFSKSTDFWDETLGKSPRPLTWDHGQDEKFKDPNPVIGKTVEWTDDEIGRWATSVLNKDKVYRKFLDEFIERKAVGTSSDSAPQYVKRGEQGKGFWIKQWPWFASAITPTPAEPRMKDFAPEFLKSWNLDKLPNADGDRARQDEALRLREREMRVRSYF